MQHNKQYDRNVLLSSFHLNGHTIGFHPQTQKLESRYSAPLMTQFFSVKNILLCLFPQLARKKEHVMIYTNYRNLFYLFIYLFGLLCYLFIYFFVYLFC